MRDVQITATRKKNRTVQLKANRKAMIKMHLHNTWSHVIKPTAVDTPTTKIARLSHTLSENVVYNVKLLLRITVKVVNV